MIRLLRAEWLRMRSRSVAHILAIVGLALMGLAAFGLGRGGASGSTSLELVAQALAGYSALVGIIIGSTFIGAEWGSGGITTMLTWEPRRERVLVAKLLVAAGTTLLIIASLALLSIPLVWVMSQEGLAGTGWGGVSETWLRAGVLGTVPLLIGASLATLLKGTVGPLVIWFVVTNAVEGLIVLRWPYLRDGMIGHALSQVLAGELGRSTWVLAGYTALIVACGLVGFSQRDV